LCHLNDCRLIVYIVSTKLALELTESNRKMHGLKISGLLVSVFVAVIFSPFTNCQVMKCAYGERGSLTATCVNANPPFFRHTTYRFDSLDETLRCTGCNLSTIEPNTFDISGNQIINLDISNCQIKSLMDSSFVGMVYMKNLNMADNMITNLHPAVFKGIKKLERLDLQNNSITAIVGYTFTNLTSLTNLNLKNNKIKFLEETAFLGLTSLVDLDLSFNQLANIKGAFDNLTSLQTLDLSHNLIQVIQPGDLSWNISNVINLNLAYNKLGILKENAFNTLENLVTLDLSYNEIFEVVPKAFTNLEKLELLNMEHNQIKALTDKTFFGMHSLTELNLAFNNLTFIKSTHFFGLTELKTLNISNNHLVKVHFTTFQSLHDLQILDLSNNNLVYIDYQIAYTHMPRIIFLNLQGNKWPCYLIAEIDEFFQSYVKLASDGILANDSCVDTGKPHTMAESLAYADEDDEGGSYANAYVVYTLIFILIAFNVVIAFLVFKLDQRNGGGRFGSFASRVHLVGNEGGIE